MKPGNSNRTETIRTTLIAPCGMNCRLCLAYARDKQAYPGCRGDDGNKAQSCVGCRIKNCEKLAQTGARYCFGCDSFPCARLKQLDKRYRTRYGMSMIDNLLNIKKFGIRRFVRNEKERWTCPACGRLMCVHRPHCLSCQRAWR